MNEVKLNFDVPELVSAINRLAEALEKMGGGQAVAIANPTPALTTAAPATAPGPAPVPMTPAPAVATPASAPAVPWQTATAACPSDVGAAAVAPAKVFTVEEVARAIAGHLTAHPEARAGLMTLLQTYQLASIADLKPEQCGAFATALRAMGVNI